MMGEADFPGRERERPLSCTVTPLFLAENFGLGATKYDEEADSGFGEVGTLTGTGEALTGEAASAKKEG